MLCTDKRKLTLLDGGLATHLESLGCDLNHALWSTRILIENPKLITKVHEDYRAAGATIGITCSYQTNLSALKDEFGLEGDAALGVFRTSARLCREVYPCGIVAGSVGPFGASTCDSAEYTGKYPPEMLSDANLKEWHQPRIESLAPLVDVFAVETIPLKAEAIAVAQLLQEVGKDAWVCFSCMDDKTTCGGDSFAQSLEELKAFSIVKGVGVNCSDPKHVTNLVKIAKRVCPDHHIVVYPNKGESYKHGTWLGDGAEDAQFVAMAKEWHAAGATIIGGCCRTTPRTIALLKQAFAGEL